MKGSNESKKGAKDKRGHIRQRSETSFEVVVNLGRDPETGRRKQHFETVKARTTKLARKAANEKLAVGEFLRQWLRDYVETNVRERTGQGYKEKINGYVVSGLGAVPLTQLQPSHLQAFYRKLLENGRKRGKGGLSATTVNQVHRLIGEALGHAVKWGLVGRNVALAVDPPRTKRREMRTLDPDGIRKVLAGAQGSVWHPVFHLAIFSGMRRSELLGLRWRDLDFSSSTATVVQTLHHLDDGRLVFEGPKTDTGRRFVALSQGAVLALRAHRERQEAQCETLGQPLTPDGLVFTRTDGSPMIPMSVTQAWRRIAQQAGVSRVSLHGTRHTHATLLLRRGVPVKVVQERLGHASPTITLGIYARVLPGMQEAAAAQFDVALAEAEAASIA